MIDSNRDADNSDNARAAAISESNDGSHVVFPETGLRTIILFSDGTGNSSGKLFKTNVWRLYEALDLGPRTKPEDHFQIAYYDNGVGTSAFRPMAILGGVFGFGLKRNILNLYKFLCRNYRPGDRIYAFGFSRGAFTIRLLVGLIASQGVVQYVDERDLAHQVRDAYRAFCANAWPNRWPAKQVAISIRWLRNTLIALKRRLFRERPYDDVVKYPAEIEFVGVWDTVAAYGGPIAEITRGIDDWIWPLTMPNYELSVKVRKARHALAIDDERDAFQPLLWDEVRELDAMKFGREVATHLDDHDCPVFEIVRPEPGRLQQVWFAGMHADVGGGYPDESLSFVSLLWMMDQTRGLRFLPDHETRIRGIANVAGPIHNSRAGIAAYYRYQPRKIAAMLDPATGLSPADRRVQLARTRALRDPEIKRDGFEDHGLLREVTIHESVLTRIGFATDGYAPINLPEKFAIAFAQPGDRAPSQLPPEMVPSLGRSGCRRIDHQERIWDFVWYRRVTYFGTVAFSLMLLVMPALPNIGKGIEICEDARCVAGSAIGLLGNVTPAFTHPWIATFSAHPSLTFLLVAIILTLMGISTWLERKLRDRTRRLWNAAFGKRVAGAAVQMSPQPKHGLLRRMRESAVYQYPLFRLKWTVLPTVVGLTLLAMMAYILVIGATQLRLYGGEQGALALQIKPFCEPKVLAKGPYGSSTEIRTNRLCNPLRVSVAANQAYIITVRVIEPWKDRGIEANPEQGARLPVWADKPAMPLRRVVQAGWFQPLIGIRSPANAGRDPQSIFIQPVELKRDAFRDDVYRGKFVAGQSGNLNMFVNDAAAFWDVGAFYRNNRGSACVTVMPAGEGTVVAKRGSACETPAGNPVG